MSTPIPKANPLVSAIIPTFNRLTFLAEAIASVLEQTYKPIELIVVDDGSTDGTKETFSARKDLLYFNTKDGLKSSENRGVSAARNLGIQKAHGSFIALLDSDDLWKPEKIARQVDYFKKYPDMMVVQTEEIWIRRGKRVNPRLIHKQHAGHIFERCLPRSIISPSAVMIRKEFFEAIGLFDENYPVCEDYEFWLRITSRYSVGLVEELLTVKRGGHNDQLSKRHSLDYYRIQALVKILDSNFISPNQRAEAASELEKKCAIYANGCKKRGREDEAQKILTLSDGMNYARTILDT